MRNGDRANSGLDPIADELRDVRVGQVRQFSSMTSWPHWHEVSTRDCGNVMHEAIGSAPQYYRREGGLGSLQ